jgi:hypothetical protein
MLPFQRLVKRYGATAAFVAAITPIPDDLVYVPLGLAKYCPRRFFVATLSGKIILLIYPPPLKLTRVFKSFKLKGPSLLEYRVFSSPISEA